MPLIQTFSDISSRAIGLFSGVKKYILDTFNRTATTAPVLGISTDGEGWVVNSGNWYANGSAAEIDDSANYQLASYNVGTITGGNQLAYANATGGMGAAVWVSAANSYWATYNYNYYTTASCNCTYGANCTYCGYNSCASCTYCGSTSYGCGSGVCGLTTNIGIGNCDTTGTTCPSSGYDVYGTGCPVTLQYVGTKGTGGCTYYPCWYEGYLSCSKCNSCPNSTCSCASCNYNCSTCYTYYYYLYLINNLGGTISNHGSIALSSAAAAVAIQTVGNNINYAAYSSSLSGEISSLPSTSVLSSGTYTSSGATMGTGVGMIKAPSSNMQSATINDFYGTAQ